MNKLEHICFLPVQTQVAIAQELEKLGMDADTTWDALSGRLVDLEDTIDIIRYTN